MSVSIVDAVAVLTLGIATTSTIVGLIDAWRLPRGAFRVNGWGCWVGVVSSIAGVAQHLRATNTATASVLALMTCAQLLGAVTNYLRRANHWLDVNRPRRPRF